MRRRRSSTPPSKGLVETISSATIWRLLDQAAIKPHHWHYWLNSHDPDFEAKMQDIVGLYLKALEMYRRGEIVLSVDEKTSIQALQRKHPTIQVGSAALIEHEYIRHGTRCLTAGFEVATGSVMGMLSPNRPAEVFAEFIQWVCDYYEDARRLHLVLDLTLLPARCRRAGDRINQVMPAHLLETAIVGAVLPLHR